MHSDRPGDQRRGRAQALEERCFVLSLVVENVLVLDPVNEPRRVHLSAKEQGEPADARADALDLAGQRESNDDRPRENGSHGCDERKEVEGRRADGVVPTFLLVQRVDVVVELEDLDARHEHHEDDSVAGGDDDAAQDEDDAPHPEEVAPVDLVGVPETADDVHDGSPAGVLAQKQPCYNM